MNPEQPRELSYEGDTLRVVLRLAGCARYAGAVFMFVWLVPWAFGEAFAANALLAFMGSSARIPIAIATSSFPVQTVSIAIASFFLVWLTFWTWGGLAAISEVLRLLFGSDTIEVTPARWSVARSYGLFVRRRSFQRDDGWSADIRRRDRALIARRGSRTRMLSPLGTPGERVWIANEIVRRFGAPVIDLRELPNDYESVHGVDGSVLIQRTVRARRGAFGCGVFCLLVWPIPFAAWLIRWNRDGIPIAGVVFLVLLTLLALWCILARQTWLVRRDYFAERLTFPGFRKVWEFRNAVLEVQSHRDSDGDERFELVVRDDAGRKKKLLSSMFEPDEPIAFGRFVSRHTGWRLVLPHDVVSS
jgi:hypothetical protein